MILMLTIEENVSSPQPLTTIVKIVPVLVRTHPLENLSVLRLLSTARGFFFFFSSDKI